MTGNRPGSWLALVGVAVAATAAVTWHFARQDLARCEVDDTLQPVAALLEDDRRIIESLVRDGYVASEEAILDTYLQRIRREGVPKNAVMKQRIDALVNNNAQVAALLAGYAPRARTPEFRAAAAKFVDYATRFRDRWQSLFEVFMAGGNLPAAGPVFPVESIDAVAAEMQAARPLF